ncbi:MAG TPA: amino acid ABC transporter substrate-binding protein [Hyphomicrobiaceae bacterium]|nr:amino acid ABC transporter substrate-binding protein [Hyphomicrobiaceae bacterium]
MIVSRVRVGTLACWILLLAAFIPIVRAQDQPLRELAIAFVDRTGDPLYQTTPGYAGLFRPEHFSALPAAELAVRDGAAAAQARGRKLSLLRKSLQEGEDAATSVRMLAQANAVMAAIIDLPADEMVQLAKAVAGEPLILFNARHREDSLRSQTCGTQLLHTLPSWSMLHDGLAQRLLELDWRRLFVLRGPHAEDKALAASFLAAARKFGLRVVEMRDFVAGNDPRKRDQINIRLLTGGIDYDALFVADALGDFARTVPFNTAKPRPIVGSAGLTASAWHPYWERHGAPQLNRRFFRLAGRRMTDQDWATWVAVRATLDAAAGVAEPSATGMFQALIAPEMKIELYKGPPGSFRSWSRQLRQPILLGTHDAVVALAPVEGALHQKNNLDTLGVDQSEFRCGG